MPNAAMKIKTKKNNAPNLFIMIFPPLNSVHILEVGWSDAMLLDATI